MSVGFGRDYNSQQLVAYHPTTQAIYVVLTRESVEYYQELARWGSQLNLLGAETCQAQIEATRDLAQELYSTIPYDFQQPWGEEIGGLSPATWQEIGAHSLMLYATYADYLDLEAGARAVAQACDAGPQGQGQDTQSQPQVEEEEQEHLGWDRVDGSDFGPESTLPTYTKGGGPDPGVEEPEPDQEAEEVGSPAPGSNLATTSPRRGGLAVAGGFLLGLGVLGWAMKE